MLDYLLLGYFLIKRAHLYNFTSFYSIKFTLLSRSLCNDFVLKIINAIEKVLYKN